MIHFDYSPVAGCKHPELTYGEVCIKCNECGRFDREYKCVNCGYTLDKKSSQSYQEWGQIEFLDVFAAPICPNCKPLFKKEDRTQVSPWWSNKVLGYRADFKPRQIQNQRR